MIDVYTIGHSNDSQEHFLDLLKQHEIIALVDIRRFPSSRKFPHFNESNLSRALQENGIEYHDILPDLKAVLAAGEDNLKELYNMGGNNDVYGHMSGVGNQFVAKVLFERFFGR